jgi:hypothetical protein
MHVRTYITLQVSTYKYLLSLLAHLLLAPSTTHSLLHPSLVLRTVHKDAESLKKKEHHHLISSALSEHREHIYRYKCTVCCGHVSKTMRHKVPIIAMKAKLIDATIES